MQYFLAIDIGASSGRHILAHLEDGKPILEEIYRFENGLHKKNGHLCWDIDGLFAEILAGMKVCADRGTVPQSVGIDTWGVDFVLLDENGARIGDAVGYRDGRTAGMDKAVEAIIPPAELYARTGIQKQLFNTVYQLMSLKKEHPEQLESAARLLFVPEYLTYLLSGEAISEYTVATTGQLINLETKTWDFELIDRLGYPRRLFGKLVPPGTKVGRLLPDIREKVGFDTDVILPPTHDTASAVAAVPMTSTHPLYISSGTWSLLGTESKTPLTGEAARTANFTNEGGYEYRYRILKNIMGLWMMQSVRREWDKRFSFAEICDAAKQTDIASVVDCQDAAFLAPDSMIDAIKDACRRTGQAVPETVGEIGAVIYNSLALCYRDAVKELETLTGVTYDAIHIVGGGSKDEYLNALTAKATGKPVFAGPTEATALGNLLTQMIAAGALPDLAAARRSVKAAFPITVFEP